MISFDFSINKKNTFEKVMMNSSGMIANVILIARVLPAECISNAM